MADMLKPSSLIAAAAVLVGVVWAVELMGSPEPDEPAPQAAAAQAVVGGDGSAVRRTAAGAQAPWSVTVSNTMGRTMDASRLFELGFAGGLVIDKDTRASIDALLKAMPENLSEADLARLERTLREGLPSDDAEKAFKLVRDYRAYAQDLRDEKPPEGIPTNLQEARFFFDQMEALKRKHFDAATANALFGQADTAARLAMEAKFVQQDDELTAEQKKGQLDALRAQLPADQRALIPGEFAPELAASQPAS